MPFSECQFFYDRLYIEIDEPEKNKSVFSNPPNFKAQPSTCRTCAIKGRNMVPLEHKPKTRFINAFFYIYKGEGQLRSRILFNFLRITSFY